jgi:hypothetical protein
MINESKLSSNNWPEEKKSINVSKRILKGFYDLRDVWLYPKTINFASR